MCGKSSFMLFVCVKLKVKKGLIFMCFLHLLLQAFLVLKEKAS